MGYPEVSITSTAQSAVYLRDKITWLLDLMGKEHHHCHTHSQRNAYQAVIRHELEIIRDELTYHKDPDGTQQSDGIPF